MTQGEESKLPWRLANSRCPRFTIPETFELPPVPATSNSRQFIMDSCFQMHRSDPFRKVTWKQETHIHYHTPLIFVFRLRQRSGIPGNKFDAPLNELRLVIGYKVVFFKRFDLRPVMTFDAVIPANFMGLRITGKRYHNPTVEMPSIVRDGLKGISLADANTYGKQLYQPKNLALNGLRLPMMKFSGVIRDSMPHYSGALAGK
ncbi:MAG: hypothetical protein V4710_10845 [Verrucomicrobiota bacterium]